MQYLISTWNTNCCCFLFSSFSVVFNEGQSDIRPSSSNVDDLALLSSLPTKSSDSYLLITDIHSNGEKLKKQFVNVLAALHRVVIKFIITSSYSYSGLVYWRSILSCWLLKVGPTKQFRAKDGRSVVCKDLTLIDETYETIIVTLWNEDLIQFSETWTQQNTGNLN